jgi:hypothetical protein
MMTFGYRKKTIGYGNNVGVIDKNDRQKQNWLMLKVRLHDEHTISGSWKTLPATKQAVPLPSHILEIINITINVFLFNTDFEQSQQQQRQLGDQ